MNRGIVQAQRENLSVSPLLSFASRPSSAFPPKVSNITLLLLLPVCISSCTYFLPMGQHHALQWRWSTTATMAA